MPVTIKIPSTLKVGSHTYKVLLDEREDDGNFGGSALHRQRELLLNPATNNQDMHVTYIHEALHILARAYCINLEEDVVSSLGEALTAFLVNTLGIKFDFSNLPTRKVRK